MRRKLQQEFSLENIFPSVNYFRLLEGKLETLLYNVHQCPHSLSSKSESSYGTKNYLSKTFLYPQFLYWLHRPQIWQTCVFLPESKILLPKVRKKIIERFFHTREREFCKTPKSQKVSSGHINAVLKKLLNNLCQKSENCSHKARRKFSAKSFPRNNSFSSTRPSGHVQCSFAKLGDFFHRLSESFCS